MKLGRTIRAVEGVLGAERALQARGAAGEGGARAGVSAGMGVRKPSSLPTANAREKGGARGSGKGVRS